MPRCSVGLQFSEIADGGIMHQPNKTGLPLATGTTNAGNVAALEERRRPITNDSVVRVRTEWAVGDRRRSRTNGDPPASPLVDSFEGSQLEGWRRHTVAGRLLYYVFEPPPRRRVPLFERVRRALGLRTSTSP